jgi:hypothetical protein
VASITSSHLEIVGYNGQQVPNTLLRQANETNHLAVFLPGLGYTCDMPLFYYAKEVLTGRGADVFGVEYNYRNKPGFMSLPKDEWRDWLRADVEAALKVVLAQRSYERLTLIGKSLGTLAMGYLLEAGSILSDTRAVWLTPLAREEILRGQVKRYGGSSLFVIGSADHHFDETLLEELRSATKGELLVIERAEHGLEIPGDVIASLEAMKRFIRALERFVSD